MLRARQPGGRWLIGLALLATSAAEARQPTLEAWVDGELTRYVAEHLATHPRFKDAAVHFVVLEEGRPAAESNRLALRLRDALANNVVDTPGIRLVWLSQDAGRPAGTGTSALDCEAQEVDYYIGLELNPAGADALHVSVRALDIRERSWVSGFGIDWRGRIGRGHRYALSQPDIDPYFLGERNAPYAETQTDLLAASLARELGCSLMRQVGGEYVLTLGETTTEGGPLDGVLDLVGANIAGSGAFRFATPGAGANAVLNSRVHRVSGDLHQVWISVTPTGGDDSPAAVSASAYIELPHGGLAAADGPREAAGVRIAAGNLLEPLRLVQLSASATCGSRAVSSWTSWTTPGDCVAVEITATDDAVVFVLAHQQNHGLVRLDDGDCRYRTAARITRAGESLRLPLPAELPASRWRQASSWSVDPRADVYYAIAVSDSRAARALANHLDELPQRCSASLRPGLEGEALARWLDGLAASVDRWQPHVDWQAVEVRNVY